MTLQWVRNRDGKLRGVAILLGRGHVEAGRNKEAPWRILRLLHLQRSHRLLHYRQRVPLPQMLAGAYLSGALQISFGECG